MSKRCIGCGAFLQNQYPEQPGFTPKEGSTFCQRCFRLTHYDDLQFSMKTGIDQDEVLKKIHEMDALVLWVVDLFDFEASLLEGMNRHLFNKQIIVVGTKRDLLPDTVGNEKLARFVFGRCKDLGIEIQGLVVTGKNIEEGKEEVLKAMQLAQGKDIVVVGMANAGKSTLLNSLMSEPSLTSSRYPGTTLDFNPLSIHGHTVYDTPGLMPRNSLLLHLKEKDLKLVLPAKSVKPVVFQIRGDQSFALAGLARFDIINATRVSAVFYSSNMLSIHRGKIEKADQLWQQHRGTLLSPCVEESEGWTMTSFQPLHEKQDFVIPGVGWLSLSGEMDEVRVGHHPAIEVIQRKAMI